MFANYVFKDKKLYDLARTHTSYTNEAKADRSLSNQRLEFLGDSVLSIIVSDYIYKNYPHLPEGSLTKIRADVVCEKSLFEMALEINLGDCLLLGKGEEMTGGKSRPSILSDAFEAMLGAVYLESGLEAVRDVLLPLIVKKIEQAVISTGGSDYKTALQELVQKYKRGPIQYHTLSEEGPDHERFYTVEVKINKTTFGRGNGKTKKQAEQMAAKEAISVLKKEYETL
ncbi:MAG: ribonuclease III [Clostridia bacterium]|nr:ribonuclease III [Clostridia bacterium]